MQKKQMLFKTKGMNRDLSVSAFNPEFSFENRNLRLSTKENNTLMSWVNERGTLQMVDNNNVGIELEGSPIGTAIIDHKLIVFTHDATSGKDYIFSIKVPDSDSNVAKVVKLYQGKLNFDLGYPLETLVSYEGDNIQKVYFTDNHNQPRLINVYYDPDSHETITGPEDAIDTRYDFIPIIQTGTIDIQKAVGGGGLFAPGVIQYCYAYYNRYGQQSNIAAISPLQYIAHENKGGSPEEKIACTFTISAENIDSNFEYVRIYSVQRTSINADAIVKVVDELAIGDMDNMSETDTNKKFTYTDNGTVGFSIDPMELLYIGGKEIKVLTMAEKDGTLFMGNITQVNTSIEHIQDKFDELEQKPAIEFHLDSTIKSVPVDTTSATYPYINYLNYDQRKITTFKGGEWYRFGFQLQKKDGEWSEPIYIGDKRNDKYPERSSSDYMLPYAYCNLPLSQLGIENVYVNIRPVVVFPSIAERAVLCQGVLNPTVFNIEDRVNKTPYAQPSWFFRPYGIKYHVSYPPGNQPELTSLPIFTHYTSLKNHCDKDADGFDMTLSDDLLYASDIEIQGSKAKYKNPFASAYREGTGETEHEVDSNSQFFIDQSIVTLNSPDIEFDTDVQTFGMGGLKLRVIGHTLIDRTVSSHSITTASDLMETARNMGYIIPPTTEVPITDHIWGIGESKYNNHYVHIGSMENGTHLIGGNLWNDAFAIRDDILNLKYDMTDGDYHGHYPSSIGKYQTRGDYEIASHNYLVNFFVHPWNRDNALNNDYRGKGEANSVLKTKKLSNMLISLYTDYHSSSTDYEHISSTIHLTENDHIYKKELPKQKVTSSPVSYYPNIDKILNNNEGYCIWSETFTYDDDNSYKRYNLFGVSDGGNILNLNWPVKDPVHMKYKSTSHALVALNADDNEEETPIPILPSVSYNEEQHVCGRYTAPEEAEANDYTTFWDDKKMIFEQCEIDVTDSKEHPLLWIGELYKEVNENSLFGGKSKSALKSNTWLVAGEEKSIRNNEGTLLDNVPLYWTDGDTYFQRYDSLKTYAFTNEDQNQVVEILSFMCETHVNIDGRYDNNRGSEVNYAASPQNFNLLNPVYSQKNNFFSYRKTNERHSEQQFKNWITYSKTKESGSDIDLWTNVTLGSVLELDGDKGQITSLNRFNDQIVAFQDSGISQILYNENVQISSTQGVPIEIANSGKVQGKRYISDTIGCSNRHSLVKTPSGIYFMDSNDKSIYMFNGQLNNISAANGFNTWCKQNIKAGGTDNSLFADDGFVAHYDKINQDVLFTNSELALAWNERLQSFTSFYDYGNTPYFENLDDTGLWLKYNPANNACNLWKHQAGKYCNFFGINKPYWMTLIGNPDPKVSKVFTNLEFRAYSDMQTPGDNQLPFTYIETWNEYQHGYTNLEQKNGTDAYKHYTADGISNLAKKFRIWRCDIPRDNALYDFNGDAARGIYRTGRHPNDRMRNPWLYLKLFHQEAEARQFLDRTEIHDVVMTYFE